MGFVLAEPKLLKLLAEQVGPWAVSGPTRIVEQASLPDTEGLTYQQIADQLQVSLTTVKKHMIRALTECALIMASL